MSHEKIFVAIVVGVTGGQPHTALRTARHIDRSAGQHGRVIEASVFLVDPKLIGCRIVGNVDVEPPVTIRIRRDHAQGATKSGPDARGRRNVLEPTAPEIVIQTIRLGVVNEGSTVVGSGARRTARLVVCQVDGEIVPDEKILGCCEIKAVTYHLLSVKKGKAWEARVLFDI